MFDHKWKYLIVKGDTALRQHSISEAESLYHQSILESDRLLKSFRSPSCKGQWTRDNCLTMISMMIFSHHNMADLWVRNGVRASQTYYLEMAHQKLIDTVRDTRFCDVLRVASFSELNRTYIPLLSHYKTNKLAHGIQILVDQYSKVRETFDAALGNNCQSTRLIH